MAKRSLFRDFMTALRAQWRAEWPGVRPIAEPMGPQMPKSSTFYAGMAPALGLHVFVNFQHSCMAWEVGHFTVNVILSRREGEPETWGGPFPPDDGLSFTEGSYRIGLLVGAKDKWWHLKAAPLPVINEAWQPVSYADPQAALREAVDNVSRDVREALGKLGVSHAPGAGGRKASAHAADANG
jgi:hypothetical protein